MNSLRDKKDIEGGIHATSGTEDVVKSSISCA